MLIDFDDAKILYSHYTPFISCCKLIICLLLLFDLAYNGTLRSWNILISRSWFSALAEKYAFSTNYLNVVYVLSTPRRKEEENKTIKRARQRVKWENNNIYRGHILNGMTNALFDIYPNVEFAKNLWFVGLKMYQFKYKILISDFNNYRVVDSMSVMEQFHEILRILGQIRQHNINLLDDCFAIASIILRNRHHLEKIWRLF